jgi:hypothetical protein
MHPTEVDTRYVSYTSTFTLPEEPLLSDVHRYRLSVACSYSYGIWGVCNEMWYTKGTISDENTNNVHEEESMNLQEREEKSVGL